MSSCSAELADFWRKLGNQFEPNDYLSAASASGINVQFSIKTASLATITLNQVNELTYLQPKVRNFFLLRRPRMFFLTHMH